MNHEKAAKITEKLIHSPVGREILGKKLGIEFNVAKAPEASIPRVAVLVPCYKNPAPEMTQAYTQMLGYTNKSGLAIAFQGENIRSGSVVHFVRNELITLLFKSQKPFTHILFLDDDICPPSDALLKLLSHGKDIVGALCTCRQDPPIPNIRWWDAEELVLREIMEWSEGSLLEVGGMGTGMILISVDALEKVAEAYFTCAYEKEMYQIPPERAEFIEKKRRERFDKTAKCMWFRFLSGLSGCDEWGEDMSFSLMAWRYAGLKVYCDTSVWPLHMGTYGYGYADFQVYRDETIARAKALGRYKNPPGIAKPEATYESKISILLPSRGRTAEVKRLLDSIRATALRMPEVIIYFDQDDPTAHESEEALKECGAKYHIGPRRTLSECWNECAKVATGDILMHGGDDIIFKTLGWDEMVANAFERREDKILFVHGDDGYWGNRFGTHGFISRKWMETVGYFVPPYFSSDYNDTWLNDVANALGVRVYLPFLTEHMHPLFGKAEWDQTHRERLERHKKDGVDELYKSLLPERQADVEKLRAVMLCEVTA